MEFKLPDTFDQLSLDSAPASPAASDLSDLPAFLDSLTCVFQEEGVLATPRYFGILYKAVGRTGSLGREEQKKLGETLMSGLGMVGRQENGNDEGCLKDTLCMLMLLFSEWLRTSSELDPRRVKSAMASLVSSDLQSLWRAKAIESRFVSLLLHSSIPLLLRGVNPTELIAWLQSTASADQWETWNASITQLLFTTNSKSHSLFVSTVLEVIRDKPEIAAALLTDVINTLQITENSEDSESIRNAAAFVEELGSRVPHVFAVGLPKLVHLLDSESYVLRNGVVSSVKSYLKFLIKHGEDGGNEAQTAIEKRTALFSLLYQRTRDKCSYCRTKAMDALRELLNDDCAPIDTYMNSLKLAKERIADAMTIVRKSAGKLLSALILRDKFANGDKYKPIAEIAESLADAKSGLTQVETRLNSAQQERESDITPDELQSMRLKLDLSVAYLTNYVEVLSDLAECCGLLFTLLESKSVSDVLTGVEGLLLMQAKGVAAAQSATRKILPLIWSKEESVRSVVTYGFHGIHTNLDLLSWEESIDRLLKLYEETTPGEHSSLEDLVKELWRQKLLKPGYMKNLRERFVAEPSAAVAFYIRCGCKFHEEFFVEFYERFGTIALAAAPKWEVLREVLAAAAECEHKSERSDTLVMLSYRKLWSPHIPFHPSWFPCLQQLIRTADCLSSSSLSLLRLCILELTKPLLSSRYSEEHLAKCVFVLGEASLKVLIAADHTKTALQNQKKWESSNNQEAELEDVSGYHASLIINGLEILTNIQETAIVSGNLLGRFTPFLLRLTHDIERLGTLLAQQAVLLTFAKFLCTGPIFCKANLPLLFQVIENESLHPSLRSNCVVAFGDLVQRFPCLLEQYSDRLFSRLRDADCSVKRKAILVVTHLVLNDMMKIRGQMAEVLLCMLDKEVRNLAYLFLEELHKKDNSAIFNLIPEALSKLTAMVGLPEANFRLIIDHLLKFVEKERQQENLIDKLSLKLLSASQLFEKLRIVHCYQQLTLTEKTLRKLLDNVAVWQALVLEDTEAKGVFDEIRTRIAKLWRSDSKAVLEEFDSRVKGVVEERPHKNPVGC